MKKKPVAILLLAASVILAVVSCIVLPQTVIMQVTTGGSSPTTMPKLAAVALPTLLSAGGALVWLFSKNDSKKALLVSCVGIFVFAFTLVVNL